jgi:hypothetical protein
MNNNFKLFLTSCLFMAIFVGAHKSYGAEQVESPQNMDQLISDLLKYKNKLAPIVCPSTPGLDTQSLNNFLLTQKGVYENLWEQMASDMWSVFEIKLKQLTSNYISKPLTNAIEYKSPGKNGCKKTYNSSSLLKVAGIQVNQFARNNNQYITKIKYTNCDNNVVLTETIFRVGTNLSKLKFIDLILGKRQFDLSSNESQRKITYKDSKSRTIGDFNTIRSGNDVYHVFSVLGQKVITLDWINSRNLYILKSMNWNYTYDGNQSRAQSISRIMRINLTDTLNIRFYDVTNHTPIAENEYQRIFQGTTGIVIKYTTKSLLNTILNSMPSSSFRASSGSKDRLLNEIKLARTKIDLGDTNYVKNVFLEELRRAVEANQIQDNRPPE